MICSVTLLTGSELQRLLTAGIGCMDNTVGACYWGLLRVPRFRAAGKTVQSEANVFAVQSEANISQLSVY